MMQQLRDHICSRLGSDLDNLDYVLSHFSERKLKRNEWLLKEGEVCRHVYFLSSGALQVFVNEDGNENTRDIVLEDNWCSDLISFGTQQPAVEQIRAIEAAEICSIDRDSFQKLLESVPQFDKVYRQILEQSYANSVYRINSFVSTVDQEVNNGKGTVNALLKDEAMAQRLDHSLKNIEQDTQTFNELLEALKHNFLFRGYFRKLEKQKKANQGASGKY